MNGIEKSMISSRSDVIVKSEMANSALLKNKDI